MKILLLLISFFLISQDSYAKETIVYKSLDNLEITADLYMTKNNKNPFIILFHQAGWSRGEYIETALRLNSEGFNCIAPDLRSGGEVNGVRNKTFLNAQHKGMGTTYLDAYIDMAATTSYVLKNIRPSKLIVLGSSYSSSLIFKLTSDFNDVIDGILSFSPGEYFKNKQGNKLTDFIAKYALRINQPVFITSAKSEAPSWRNIYNSIPSKDKVSFTPKTNGNHGSRALWSKWSDAPTYWIQVNMFLKQFKTK